LTKRPENITDYMPQAWIENPPDFIRVGVTVENQEMADKRIPVLLNSWKGKNFISVEPMLSEITLTKWIGCNCPHDCYGADVHNIYCPASDKYVGKKLDQIICGCESGANMKPGRPCNIEWIRDLRDQCIDAKVPFFLKQLNIDGKLVKEPFLDGRQWLEFPKGE